MSPRSLEALTTTLLRPDRDTDPHPLLRFSAAPLKSDTPACFPPRALLSPASPVARGSPPSTRQTQPRRNRSQSHVSPLSGGTEPLPVSGT